MSESMTAERFRDAALATRELLEKSVGKSIRAKRSEHATAAEHLAWMLNSCTLFYFEGKPQKANRWLGYVQGVMAALSYATLEELKRANMPPGEQFDGAKV